MLRARGAKPIAFIVSTCFILLSHATNSRQQNDAFDTFYEAKNQAVRDVAVNLAKVMAPSARCRASQNCNRDSCLPTDCANDAFESGYRCSGLLLASSGESICPTSCSPTKRLLNLQVPFLSFTPGSLQHETRDGKHNIRVRDQDLIRDACAVKSMSSSLRESFRNHKLKSWLYASTSTGLMMTYPGSARERQKTDIERCGYVPMSRPWYIAAASGSKDVVFLLDTTSLVSADKVLSNSLQRALTALERSDYVAVFAVDEEPKILGNFSTLQSATEDVKELLLSELKRLPPASGNPAIEYAFLKAFDLLHASQGQQKSSYCSKIIVLLLGSEPECFVGCRSSKAQTEGCRCTSEIIRKIKLKQESFADDKVSITTFTEGKNNDAQRLARSLVCESSNPGVWSHVSSNQSPDTSLLAYTDIASLTQTRQQYTSAVYTDAFGLGEMFTIAQPVYDQESRRLVGVVGVDTTIGEAAEAVGDRETAISGVRSKWESENRGCQPRILSGCERQKLRQRYGGMCADVLVGGGKPWKCFRAGNSLYWRSESEQTWAEARGHCESAASDLAIIDNIRKNQIAASISSLDGSWIGLAASRSKPLLWVNDSQFLKDSLGFSIARESLDTQIKTLHDRGLVDACISIDRRGVEENWNVVPCDAKRFAICEMPIDSPNATQNCPAEVIFDPRATEYEPFNQMDCDLLDSPTCPDDEEEVKRANPICPDKSSEVKSDFDRQCCGGRSDSGSSQNAQCEDDDVGSNIGVIIGISVSVVLAVFLVAALFVIWKYCRKRPKVKTPVDSGNSPTSTSSLPEPTLLDERDIHSPIVRAADIDVDTDRGFGRILDMN
ncbi:unnamed protein product [Agarophyton chilense]